MIIYTKKVIVLVILAILNFNLPRDLDFASIEQEGRPNRIAKLKGDFHWINSYLQWFFLLMTLSLKNWETL